MSELTTPNTENNLTALAHRAPEVADMFTTLEAFNAGWKMAGALCNMNILPEHYRGENNRANCMMLLSLAHGFRHMGASPFMIAQQLVPVKGKFGWQGQFVTAVVNASHRFAQDLQFKFEGTPDTDNYGCTAWTTKADGTVIEGTKITWKMVRGEGWDATTDKNGKKISKWLTMPEQMFRYRAAAFFGRAYTPDLLMGFGTADELEDMKDVTPQAPSKGSAIESMLMGNMNKPMTATDARKSEENLHEEFKQTEEGQAFQAEVNKAIEPILEKTMNIVKSATDESFSKEDSIWEDMKLAEAERLAEEQ